MRKPTGLPQAHHPDDHFLRIRALEYTLGQVLSLRTMPDLQIISIWQSFIPRPILPLGGSPSQLPRHSPVIPKAAGKARTVSSLTSD